MSHKASHWLADIPANELSSSAFRVLFHLCDAHNSKRDPETACFPSQEQLRKVTGLSNGGLNNALNAIEKSGFICRNRTRNADGTRGPTYYILGCDLDVSHYQTPNNGDGTNSILEGKPSPFEGTNHLHPSGVEPIIEPVRLSIKAAQPNEFDQLQEQLLEAAGLGDFRAERSPGLMNLSPILGLLDAGYSLQGDIIPAIRSRCSTGFRPKSWAYFVDVVRGAKQARQSAGAIPKPTKPETSNDDWQKRLDYLSTHNDWPHAWGPKPGEHGCRVPAHLSQTQAA